MAAENLEERRADLDMAGGFNEAAAHGRGKHRSRRSISHHSTCSRASMRPRRMAAENAAYHVEPALRPARFNEAAAHGRGKRAASRSSPARGGRASMRPRRMAAENILNLRICTRYV